MAFSPGSMFIRGLFYSLPETGFHNRLPWGGQLLEDGRKLLKETKVMKKLEVKLRQQEEILYMH